MAKGRHRSEKQKLYWWQRKRLISLYIQTWLFRIQEFKFELQEALWDVRQVMKKYRKTNKEKNARKNDERNT